jgi:nicotinate-nucleotide pyrophosphorylase (carboxylating)
VFVDWIDPSRFDLSSLILLKDNYIWSSSKDTLTILLSLLFDDVETHDKDKVIQAIMTGSNAIALKGNELNPVTRSLRRHVSRDENSFCSRRAGA